MIDKTVIYQAVSDFISDSYDWLSRDDNQKQGMQYILGMNDLARYLVEKIEEKEKENGTNREI